MISNSFKIQDQTRFGSKFAVETFPLNMVRRNHGNHQYFELASGKTDKRISSFNEKITALLSDLKNNYKGKLQKGEGKLILDVKNEFDSLVETSLTALKKQLSLLQLFTKKQDKVKLTWTKLT